MDWLLRSSGGASKRKGRPALASSSNLNETVVQLLWAGRGFLPCEGAVLLSLRTFECQEAFPAICTVTSDVVEDGLMSRIYGVDLGDGVR